MLSEDELSVTVQAGVDSVSTSWFLGAVQNFFLNQFTLKSIWDLFQEYTVGHCVELVAERRGTEHQWQLARFIRWTSS